MRSYHVKEMEVFMELKYVIMPRVQEDADYLQYIISMYNKEDSALEDAECLYLEKYLPRYGKYCVVSIDGKERIVTKEEAQKNGYEELIYGAEKKPIISCQAARTVTLQKLTREELENFINNNLISIGFERVYDTERETILFNKDRNIVFYVNDKDKFVSGYYYYHQPKKDDSGKLIMDNFNNVDSCSTELIPFPKFSIHNYPRVIDCEKESKYNELKEYFRDPFLADFYLSMERISQIPVLMEAIGEENRAIIYEMLNSYNDNKGNKCLKK